MKISKSKLNQIIKEETANLLKEAYSTPDIEKAWVDKYHQDLRPPGTSGDPIKSNARVNAGEYHARNGKIYEAGTDNIANKEEVIIDIFNMFGSALSRTERGEPDFHELREFAEEVYTNWIQGHMSESGPYDMEDAQLVEYYNNTDPHADVWTPGMEGYEGYAGKMTPHEAHKEMDLPYTRTIR